MKNVLLFGCGSKWGAEFTKTIADAGYNIDLVTGSDFSYKNVTTYKIDWFGSNLQTLREILLPLTQKQYDIIFFNQNTGGGPNEQAYAPGDIFPIDHWNVQNWINSQLPYVAVKLLNNSIHKSTKVGWMITGLVDGKDKNLWKYAGYASVKSTNIHIMRGFANHHHGIFFALDPSWFPEDQYQKDAETILSKIENLEITDTGSIVKKD
jgi:hypothetical protein